MKACVLHGIGDLRYEDVPRPVPKYGEVLIKIMASGICGSDIGRVFVKGTYHFPTIPGHEFSGRIVEVGEGTDAELIGRKTTVFPLLPCMKCSACQIGEYGQCRNYNYFGSRCDGGFAEYIAVPVWNLVLVPEALSFEEAAMAEPAAVAIHALRQAGVQIGDQVLILGAGPIGLMLGKLARIWGAEKVLLIDIDEEKIAFARAQGFSFVCNSLVTDPDAWVMEHTGAKGADLAIEGTGVSAGLEQCLKSTRSFGKIVAMGNPAGEIRLSQNGYWELLRKQLTITGTWNSSYVLLPKNDWTLAIQMMERKDLSVTPFITHRLKLSEVPGGLEMMRNHKEFYNKVMYIAEEK